VTTYNPEKWLDSTIRCLVDYTYTRLSELLNLDSHELYDVVSEFPAPALADRSREVPLTKIVIHFEMDALEERVVGFGENVFANNYDPELFANFPQEATLCRINFDVGIWSSDRTGGTTARFETRRLLSQIFAGATALQAFRTATDGGDGGIEIVRYSGGRFATDKINDVIVYRAVDGTLETKVFSRTPLPLAAGPTIEQITQSPGLTVLG
jgi:hypothetical protein